MRVAANKPWREMRSHAEYIHILLWLSLWSCSSAAGQQPPAPLPASPEPSCVREGSYFARGAHGGRNTEGEWRPHAEPSVSSPAACQRACCGSETCSGFDYDHAANACYLLHTLKPTQSGSSIGSCAEACSDAAEHSEEPVALQPGECGWVKETFRPGCDHYTVQSAPDARLTWEAWVQQYGKMLAG